MFGRRERDDLRAQLQEAEAELERRRSSPIENAIGHGVVVHIDDRRSVAGVLTGVYDGEVTLESARLLQEGTGAIGQDGTIAIPVKRIGWWQLRVAIDDSRLPA